MDRFGRSCRCGQVRIYTGISTAKPVAPGARPGLQEEAKYAAFGRLLEAPAGPRLLSWIVLVRIRFHSKSCEHRLGADPELARHRCWQFGFENHYAVTDVSVKYPAEGVDQRDRAAIGQRDLKTQVQDRINGHRRVDASEKF